MRPSFEHAAPATRTVRTTLRGRALPIVYTPTIGEAIERCSHEYRRPRGLYLSISDPGGIDTAFDSLVLGAGEVDLLVCTDGESILGIGDWRVNGIDISIGELAVYTDRAVLERYLADLHPELARSQRHGDHIGQLNMF